MPTIARLVLVLLIRYIQYATVVNDLFQMLKPRALTAVLAQANTEGVRASLLFKADGTLLSQAVTEQQGEEPASDPRVVAAIASNIWSVYDRLISTVKIAHKK